MTAPTSIADAMLSAINAAIADVDTVSSTEFTPAITTTKIAALSPAFDLESRFLWESLGGAEVVVIHRIPIEFWVKHDGKTTHTMTRARNIGTDAINALVAADGSGYYLDFDDPVTFAVDPAFVTINSVAWLVATMFVSVRDTLTIA